MDWGTQLGVLRIRNFPSSAQFRSNNWGLLSSGSSTGIKLVSMCKEYEHKIIFKIGKISGEKKLISIEMKISFYLPRVNLLGETT